MKKKKVHSHLKHVHDLLVDRAREFVLLLAQLLEVALGLVVRHRRKVIIRSRLTKETATKDKNDDEMMMKKKEEEEEVKQTLLQRRSKGGP